MNDFRLSITSVENGFMIQGRFGENDYESTVVVADKEDDWNALATVNFTSAEGLLWEIIDYFSLGGSKHDKYRIRVVKEKQDWVDED